MLHALAQGGRIVAIKNEKGNIASVECFSREGWLLNQCTLLIFQQLRRKKSISSRNSGPYCINRRGLELVRSQLNNR